MTREIGPDTLGARHGVSTYTVGRWIDLCWVPRPTMRRNKPRWTLAQILEWENAGCPRQAPYRIR